jgi:hypothetical protein
MRCYYKTRVLLLIVLFVVSLAIPGFPGLHVSAQQSKIVVGAPIPAQILAAKKVFVANAGSEDPSPDDPFFNGGRDRAYNQFYASVKTWGKYELVGGPGDADLLFELRFTVPPAPRAVVRGESAGSASYDPQLRLEIRDPKSRAILWGFTEHAQWAMLKGNRDKNFDLAMARLVADTQELSAQSTANAAKK